MSHDSRLREPLSPTILVESSAEPVGPDLRRCRGALKRRWRVRFDGGEEHVEADHVEITDSGALAFYRSASRMEQERTLLTAFPAGLWWRCWLEGER
jgi:hypothetical protein